MRKKVGFEENGGGGTTLMETAEREAQEAEAEFEAGARDEPAEEAESTVKSEPGEQGIATQDEEESTETPKVWDRSPSQNEIVFANDELIRLRESAHEMGAQAAIDALIKVVDVHPAFQIPVEWPGEAEEAHVEAPYLADMGRFLARACSKIEISAGKVVFLWKNKKSWTKQGVQVRAQSRKLGDVASFFAHGARAVVIGNFQLFRLLNTRQKIAAVYHALRQLDADGAIRPNQFEGFFDEVELFGTGTFQTDVMLRRAIEHGAQRELPFEEPENAFGTAAATDPDDEDEDEDDA